MLLALTLGLVLFPLAALGVSTYARSGTVGELQRSADSGALAGAARIPLGDLDSVTSGVFPGAPDAIAIACEQARAALDADDALGEEHTLEETCTARWLADPAFLARFATCMSNLTLLPAELYDPLIKLLPALARSGVELDLERTFDGRANLIDELIAGGATGDSGVVREERVARARRRFKNVIVVPIVVSPLSPTTPEVIDLNPALASSHDSLLAAVEEIDLLTDSILAPYACDTVLDAFQDDFSDLYNPGSGTAPTLQEVIDDARAQQAPVLAFLIEDDPPPADPLGGLRIPFFDFVPVCIRDAGIAVIAPEGFTGCAANAPGAFRATLVHQ